MSAAITKNTLQALTQALKLACSESKAKTQTTSFNGEEDLALFLPQFKNFAIVIDETAV